MKILIIHSVHEYLAKTLVGAGFDVVTRLNLSRNQVLEILANYDGLIVRSALKVDREVINAGSRLKFVGRLGAGMENIDTEYAATQNIVLFNAPEGNRSAVGEHALGMLLCLQNKLLTADAEVRHGIWNRNSNWGEEIEGKTVGIIGYGNMGSAFAKKLSGFGARIIAYDKYKTGFGNGYTEETSLNTLFEEADIVSLHVPLKEDTFHMLNNSFIDSFKKQIVLINTSRGAVVNTSDLVSGLKSKKIKGACLDVLEFEGMSFEALEQSPKSGDFAYLSKAKNVVLSPHIAGWTFQSNQKMAVVMAEKIITHFAK